MNTISNGRLATDLALEYIGRGWSPIPIPDKQKAPTIRGWQALRVNGATVGQHFNSAPQNIGILLGEPSGWLIDVDLDHPRAVELAAEHLPVTGAKFGRASKPASHWLYRVSAPIDTEKHQTAGRSMIVELRSTGAQTVFPGSVHPSGERIEWQYDGEPAIIAPDELRAAVERLADAVKRECEVHEDVPDKAPAVPNDLGRAELVERCWNYVSKMRDAISGQDGHGATFAAAAECFRFGLTDKEACKIMQRFNAIKTGGETWNDKQLAHKMNDAREAVVMEGQFGCHVKHDEERPTKRSALVVSDVNVVDPWPDPLGEEGYYGLLGDIVRTIEPHTESDPVAILAQAIVAFGSVIGRAAHFTAEADKHFANLFACLVGETAKGRKGTSWGQTRKLLLGIDDVWLADQVLGGLSSGEGLVHAVRDPQWGLNKQGEVVLRDKGVTDKRLLVLEPEFASVLQVMQREKNTLSAIIRAAWDSGSLGTLTKNSPTKATDAHISIVGHITRDELKRLITETHMANGLANRFLWLGVRRSKCLPEGGSLDDTALTPLASRLKAAVEHGKAVGEIQRNEHARQLWYDIYPDLSREKPGLLGAATSRAEPQVMRLAMIYALLDMQHEIGECHLQAALALWRYVEQSARYVFGNALGNATADAILRLLKGNPNGATRTDIRDYFNRNKSQAEIDHALTVLSEHHLARPLQVETGGRTAEVWIAT